jgi:hypothetical protein
MLMYMLTYKEASRLRFMALVTEAKSIQGLLSNKDVAGQCRKHAFPVMPWERGTRGGMDPSLRSEARGESTRMCSSLRSEECREACCNTRWIRESTGQPSSDLSLEGGSITQSPGPAQDSWPPSHILHREVFMKVATFQGTVENGQIRLPAGVRLPEKVKVYVVIPDIEIPSFAYIGSPRLAHPEQAADFKKEVIEEIEDASV